MPPDVLNISRCTEHTLYRVIQSQFFNQSLNVIPFTKAKDKEQFEWLGDIQQLKDFVSIILNASGKWRKSGNKNIFKEDGGKFTLCWWSSNSTSNVQASQDSTEKLKKKME